MGIREIQKEIKKLNKDEKNFLILYLLKQKDIIFTDISILYTKYLEWLDERNATEKRIMAGCLASKYSKSKDMEYVNARSSILLHPYVPDEFIKTMVLKGTTKKTIKREKEYILREML